MTQTNKQVSERTPLFDVASADTDNAAVQEKPLCAKLTLRGQSDEFFTACEKTLGLALPKAPNTLNTASEMTAFWLGPDEWLLHLPLQQLDATTKALHAALADTHSAITDVSDYYTVLALDTPKAAQIIACGSAFDSREFSAGQCAQIRFGHASVLLWPESQGYGVQVRWSYAAYLFHYFQQSLARLETLENFKP